MVQLLKLKYCKPGVYIIMSPKRIQHRPSVVTVLLSSLLLLCAKFMFMYYMLNSWYCSTVNYKLGAGEIIGSG